MNDVPSRRFPECFGFRSGARGTHTSRTIMLAEVGELLAARSASTNRQEYYQAIVTDNVLRKRTLTTRRGTAQRLSELYALDPKVTLFRLFRTFWDADRAGRPLLALLCAAARDPLLRLTIEPVLQARPGQEVSADMLDAALAESAPDRFKPAVRRGVARRAASSWTQACYLAGRSHKVRRQPTVTPACAAYALALGYLQGERGPGLFTTLWARLLDVPAEALRELAAEASRRDWLNYRHAGGITEVRFPQLLTPAEEESLRVAN
jgi:hypothetical protein